MADVRSVLRAARSALAAAGVASPQADSELLLAHVLGCHRNRLLAGGELSRAEQVEFDRLLTERGAGRPVQHLTGRAPFRRLELRVGPGVFIPRPETELLPELAAAELARAELVADLCAGSGAIGLSVAQEHPGVQVVAVERSTAALAWLNRNAAEQELPNFAVVAGDIADPALLDQQAGRFDVVLSNPPYVPTRLRKRLGPEVAFDPAEAVFAGEDGLALLPALVAAAARLLRPGGLLAFEHDESQRAAAAELLGATGLWHAIAASEDLTGRDRFTAARRN